MDMQYMSVQKNNLPEFQQVPNQRNLVLYVLLFLQIICYIVSEADPRKKIGKSVW